MVIADYFLSLFEVVIIIPKTGILHCVHLFTIVKENAFLTLLILRAMGYSRLVPASSNLLRSENAHNGLGSQERRQIYSIGRKPLWFSHETPLVHLRVMLLLC